MNKYLAIGLIISGFIVLFSIGSYNAIATNEEFVFQSFGNLDSALQRRFDLIPNLVATVKGYANHESQTLIATIEARAKVGMVHLDAKQLGDEKAVASFMAKQNQLQGSLHKLLAIAEAYPDLKANQNFLDLQHQLEGTENRINYARNEMNAAVRQFNSCIRRFPNSIINAIFAHLESKQPFNAPDEAKANVVVDLGAVALLGDGDD